MAAQALSQPRISWIEEILAKVAQEMEQSFVAEGNIFVRKNLMAESFADLNYTKQPDYDPGIRYLYFVDKVE